MNETASWHTEMARKKSKRRKGGRRVRTLLGADLEFLDLHEAARMFLIRVVFFVFLRASGCSFVR